MLPIFQAVGTADLGLAGLDDAMSSSRRCGHGLCTRFANAGAPVLRAIGEVTTGHPDLQAVRVRNVAAAEGPASRAATRSGRARTQQLCEFEQVKAVIFEREAKWLQKPVSYTHLTLPTTRRV